MWTVKNNPIFFTQVRRILQQNETKKINYQKKLKIQCITSEASTESKLRFHGEY
jgi:hypothetical protein